MARTEKLPRRKQLGDNEEAALRLRTLGLTYREIAKQTGVPLSTAYSRVMRGLRDLRRRQHEAPADVRNIELLKLAQLERRVMAEAVSGDHGAIRLLLRIMDCRKRYLATCLPNTSSKEELEELLRVFTQPLESGLFADGKYPDDECDYGELDPADDEPELDAADLPSAPSPTAADPLAAVPDLAGTVT